ncbi:hypothetical protein [Clostridium sp. LIBA-8841]|uniref:hypothetical protein n=1 Tax=Clostridium sp. LIBA-8841 TaxID=2987530 RepID=UPI002AC3A2BB|nr:hypothetical protein [Clostridium sp. LIBA-8841]MDZ5252249.1 hypothetical protein [Clostridium sp. LIBA-8841]
MKRVLLVIGSCDGSESNSYCIANYIEDNLDGRVKCSKILLSEYYFKNINEDLKVYDNIVFISSLKKDRFNDLSERFLNLISNENEEGNRNIYFSVILNGDLDVLRGTEELELLLENCMKICKKKFIVWQKGIGVLADLNLWKNGLEDNGLEYEQLLIELEMFCEDIINCKTYHHNSFALPRKGSGFLKFINKRIKHFT